ncbi:MAG: hypothetical protein H0W47_05125 [Polaromonas sp.]|uniref:hypothetical protein n=1 Tax=Polaromonas sp. TaxID=1869339 RepID=UPI0017BD657F|nr:hypothetical protein [Polaromonas sp.]MBA3593164.1 hypothetical protein [Polaromonas sp.]
MNGSSFLRRGALVALGTALCLAFLAGSGLAATEKAKKTSAVKKQGSTKFLPGSQETRKERSERLKRECKGRVNAGACTGYTD